MGARARNHYPTAYRSPAARQAFNGGRPSGQIVQFPRPFRHGPRPDQFGPARKFPARPFGRVPRYARPASAALGGASRRVLGRVLPVIALAGIAWEAYRRWAHPVYIPPAAAASSAYQLHHTCSPPLTHEFIGHDFVYGQQSPDPNTVLFTGCLASQASYGSPVPTADDTEWGWGHYRAIFLNSAGDLRYDVQAVYWKQAFPAAAPHRVHIPNNVDPFDVPYLQPWMPPALAPDLAARPAPAYQPLPEPPPYGVVPDLPDLPLTPYGRNTWNGVQGREADRSIALEYDVGSHASPASRPRPANAAKPRNRPPKPREREEKGKVRKALSAIPKALAGWSEFNDFIDVAYRAIPKASRRRWERRNGRELGVRYLFVATHLDEIDFDQFVSGWLANEAEDQLVGRAIGRIRNEAHRIDPSGGLWALIVHAEGFKPRRDTPDIGG